MEKLILVTGATGFTGGHLARCLMHNGGRVRALVRDAGRAQDLSRQGIELAFGDLRDKRSLQAATDGVHTVYHIGALFRPENVPSKEFFNTNVAGTRNLLDASIASGVQRFVHCSSVAVHGDLRVIPGTESSPYAPWGDYQNSKAEGEKLVIRYMREQRLPISIFRPVGIYGPGDLRFLKLFKAVKRRLFCMIGDGNVWFHMIYIDDLVNGIISCGEQEKAVGEIFILAGSEPCLLTDLVKTIANILGVPKPRLKIPIAPSMSLDILQKFCASHSESIRRFIGGVSVSFSTIAVSPSTKQKPCLIGGQWWS